ncbi:lipase secretion chaperone [Marinobacter sp. CHS3-4]|uniref:lipase secretion chaperone n=1 Tax=Marinobacter sp. CHS3-4 TaxID=3045174 RepID=UPI0024B48C2B|nr:lipase secretion chaperone [Marinobacter sp. CHS3-4]MDI9243896.1 lipase secretion chaperone [Marinobacter sp. CHS3-4]
MIRQWLLPAAGSCLAAGVLVFFWPSVDHGSPSEGSAVTPVEVSAANGPRPSVTLPNANTEAALPPLPPELRGLEPDAQLRTDENGNLIPSEDLKVLLDFYLANIDQEPLATVLARIRSALAQRLQEPALSQSLSLLERYVGYRMALDSLEKALPDGMAESGFDQGALRQRLSRLEQLQHDYFAREEIDAFFEDDLSIDRFTLARIDIQQNPSLTAEERQQQLKNLEQTLPQPVREARKRAVIHGDVYQQAEAMKASNASDAELYQFRASQLGEEAALELAELDRKQQAWRQRLAHYQQEKSRVIEAGLSESDQANAISELQNRLFNDREQLRVRALDADSL